MRVFDIFFATIGLIVFAPVLCLLALLIRLEDGGQIFFVQKRLGKKRKPFRVIKLRTMKDDQVTSIGRFVRKTGIDEVMQFLNVLRGEMSMVGPRPLTLEDTTRLGWTADKFERRWSINPGVTGLAQIFSGRGARVSWFLDQKYLTSQNPWVDIKLIVVSFVINVFGKTRVQKWLR